MDIFIQMKIAIVGNSHKLKKQLISSLRRIAGDQHLIDEDNTNSFTFNAKLNNVDTEVTVVGLNFPAGLEDSESFHDAKKVLSCTNLVIILFSLINTFSFKDAIEKWIPEVKRHVPHAPYILVGTDCYKRNHINEFPDLKEVSIVSTEKGLADSRIHRCYNYFEVDQEKCIGIIAMFKYAILTGMKALDQLHKLKYFAQNEKASGMIVKVVNSVKYAINDNEAFVVGVENVFNDEITIRNTIKRKHKEYKVTKIMPGAFLNSSISSIQLEKGSKITEINENCFPATIERLDIPSLDVDLKVGWSKNLKSGMKVRILNEKRYLILFKDCLYHDNYEFLEYIPECCDLFIFPPEVNSFSDSFFLLIDRKKINKIKKIEITNKKPLLALRTNNKANFSILFDSKVENIIIQSEYNTFNIENFNNFVFLTKIEVRSTICFNDIEEDEFPFSSFPHKPCFWDQYSIFSDCIYTKDFSTLLFVPRHKTTLIIHNDTEEIGDNAARNTNFFSINFKNDESKLRIIGVSAFENSRMLKFRTISEIELIKSYSFKTSLISELHLNFSKKATFEKRCFPK